MPMPLWADSSRGGFELAVASTPSTECDALCVQVLGSQPPVDGVHADASLCTCDVCALTCCGLGSGYSQDYCVFCEGVSRWSLVWFRDVCAAPCVCRMHCMVARGDAWPTLLSPCYTLLCHGLWARGPWHVQMVIPLSTCFTAYLYM